VLATAVKKADRLRRVTQKRTDPAVLATAVKKVDQLKLATAVGL
jgi:hypothetical protein